MPVSNGGTQQTKVFWFFFSKKNILHFVFLSCAMRFLILCIVLAACANGGHKVVSRPPPQPFCTRTLGVPECFADPAALPDHPAELADTPVREHVECDSIWKDGGLPCKLEQWDRP
jgi:hypothetical protein